MQQQSVGKRPRECSCSGTACGSVSRGSWPNFESRTTREKAFAQRDVASKGEVSGSDVAAVQHEVSWSPRCSTVSYSAAVRNSRVDHQRQDVPAPHRHAGGPGLELVNAHRRQRTTTQGETQHRSRGSSGQPRQGGFEPARWH